MNYKILLFLLLSVSTTASAYPKDGFVWLKCPDVGDRSKDSIMISDGEYFIQGHPSTIFENKKANEMFDKLQGTPYTSHVDTECFGKDFRVKKRLKVF